MKISVFRGAIIIWKTNKDHPAKNHRRQLEHVHGGAKPQIQNNNNPGEKEKQMGLGEGIPEDLSANL